MEQRNSDSRIWDSILQSTKAAVVTLFVACLSVTTGCSNPKAVIPSRCLPSNPKSIESLENANQIAPTRGGPRSEFVGLEISRQESEDDWGTATSNDVQETPRDRSDNSDGELLGPGGEVAIGIGALSPSGGELKTTVGGVIPTLDELDYDPGFLLSVRGTHWFGTPGIVGVGGDFSIFGVNAVDETTEQVDVETFGIALSPLLFVRFPNEAFQPYAAIGPALVTTVVTVDISGIDSESATGAATGLDARIGCRFRVAEDFGLFAEVRHLSFDTEYQGDGFLFEIEEIEEFRSTGFVVGACIGF